MSSGETRNSLIVRLRSEQNELAWREFVTVYESFLIQVARRQGVPGRHLPDVTQQILLRIAESIDGWSDDGNQASFRRWLTTVARNVVVRFMARERRQAGGSWMSGRGKRSAGTARKYRRQAGPAVADEVRA